MDWCVSGSYGLGGQCVRTRKADSEFAFQDRRWLRHNEAGAFLRVPNWPWLTLGYQDRLPAWKSHRHLFHGQLADKKFAKTFWGCPPSHVLLIAHGELISAITLSATRWLYVFFALAVCKVSAVVNWDGQAKGEEIKRKWSKSKKGEKKPLAFGFGARRDSVMQSTCASFVFLSAPSILRAF